MKKWAIISEGLNNAVITKAVREENGIAIQAETDTIVWKWRISDKIIYDALVVPALDGGYTGNAEDYKGLAEWINGKGIKVWHTDTKKAGAYRHRYYINEFVDFEEAEPQPKHRRITKAEAKAESEAKAK